METAIKWTVLKEIDEALKSSDGVNPNTLLDSENIKEKLDNLREELRGPLWGKPSFEDKQLQNLYASTGPQPYALLSNLELLSIAFDPSKGNTTEYREFLAKNQPLVLLQEVQNWTSSMDDFWKAHHEIVQARDKEPDSALGLSPKSDDDAVKELESVIAYCDLALEKSNAAGKGIIDPKLMQKLNEALVKADDDDGTESSDDDQPDSSVDDPESTSLDKELEFDAAHEHELDAYERAAEECEKARPRTDIGISDSEGNIDWKVLEEMHEALTLNLENDPNTLSVAHSLKTKMEKIIESLGPLVFRGVPFESESLQELYSKLDPRVFSIYNKLELLAQAFYSSQESKKYNDFLEKHKPLVLIEEVKEDAYLLNDYWRQYHLLLNDGDNGNK